jgi:hypothetical protein
MKTQGDHGALDFTIAQIKTRLRIYNGAAISMISANA